MANVSSYKSCFVPGCENTTFSAPDKIFFNVPKGERRVQWCAAAGVRKELSLKSTHACCQDHFNVKEDVENWRQYHYIQQMGMKARLRLKRDALPHIFDCHKSKKHVSDVNVNKKQVKPVLVATSSSKGVNENISCKESWWDSYYSNENQSFGDDQFFVNAKEGVQNLKNNAVGNQSTRETNEETGEEDVSSQFEDSPPVSYLATAVLGEQGEADHAENIVPMSVDKEDCSPAITKLPVSDEPDIFNRVLDIKNLGSNAPEHLLNYVVSLHNELQQKKIECQKSKRKASRLEDEVQLLRSGLLNGESIEPSVNEYQIQDTKGKKVRCFAVGLSGLDHLNKKGVVPDPSILSEREEKENSDDETNENSTNESSKNENSSSEDSTSANNRSDISNLQARVIALESECNTLRTANSQLINEKAEVLNEYHKLKAELKRLWKDHWHLQMLNTQLTSDNEKLLESLKEMENLPND